MCAEWLAPGRLLVRPDSSPATILRLTGEAEVVQLAEPLSRPVLDSLAQAIAANPAVELYVYGHDGIELDGDLGFLNGFEQLQHLSLNVRGLQGLDGLSRLTELRALTLQGIAKRTFSVAALARVRSLERLVVDRPVRDLEVVGRLERLNELNTPATPAALAGIEGHPSVRRVILSRGSHRDLSPLTTCPELLDLELWQIRQLSTADLAPLTRIEQLDALALGAARQVTDLQWLPPRVRFLSLEKVPQLDSYAPLAALAGLIAFGAWESRAQDRSLRPLHGLPLEDLVLGDAFPEPEVAALLRHTSARTWISRSRPEPVPAPVLSWRGLLSYADWHRRKRSS
jgi:hypothetical protein